MGNEPRHTYEYDIDLDSDTAPARVLRMVRPGSKVLEIGAGPGSITRHLSGTLGCDVVALEIDPTAIEKLRSFARAVHALDLNNASWAETLRQQHGQFDFVIAADVLEHVYDPWRVLGEMKSLLNETGSIILSLPHVGHAAVAACLFDEDFEYRPWGLLDRTHIRFFGIKNVQELYESQGLTIEQAEFVVRTPEMTEFVHRWNRLPTEIRAALLSNRFSNVYQVVSRAVPKARAKRNLRLLELAVSAPDKATSRHWKSMMRSLPPEKRDFSSTFSSETRIQNSDSSKVRLVAFYLPQFHPIPENDKWWGKGFTEWTNVTKSVPLFQGHYQPHLPTDLGFYDLRLRQTRHEQIALAKANGIDGFCYHYYWFSGQRLLDQPLDDMLADPASDMPFCLCWANENWTRRWDGAEHELLIAQEYRAEDDVEFIRSVLPFMRDKRYIRVDGAPLLVVYFPRHLPDAVTSTRIWREICEQEGIGRVHLACALTHGNWEHTPYGFDSGVEFPPHNLRAPDLAKQLKFPEPCKVYCPDYSEIGDMYLSRQYGAGNSVFRGLMPSWDNSARRGRNGSTVVLNGTPENYEYWLSEAIRRTGDEFPGQDRLVFINAWNEWAEGCHLEPDRRYAHAYLEATVAAKAGGRFTGWTHRGLAGAGQIKQSTPIAIKKQKKKKKKSLARRTFRIVRDTVTGRSLRKRS